MECDVLDEMLNQKQGASTDLVNNINNTGSSIITNIP